MDWETEDNAQGYDGEASVGAGASGGVARSVPGDLSVGGMVRDTWQHVINRPLETIGGLLAMCGVMSGIQLVMYVGMYVGMLFVIVAGGMMGEVVGESAMLVLTGVGSVVGGALLFALIIAVQGLAMSAYFLLWLKVVRRQEESINYPKVLRVMFVPIVLGATLQGLAVGSGFFLLVVGMFVLMVGLAMVPFLILDHGMQPMQAIKSSWSLMRGHKLELFILLVVLTIINCGGMLACGVGMLVTTPLTYGAVALFYDRIAIPGNAYLRI